MTREWGVPGYSVVRELGRGATGTVVEATYDTSGSAVAIKYLGADLLADEAFRAAFRDEARLLSRIDAPNVARLFEYVESTDGAAIVMEPVHGAPLRAMLAEPRPPARNRAADHTRDRRRRGTHGGPRTAAPGPPGSATRWRSGSTSTPCST